MILEHAVDLEWRTDNPTRRISVQAPKTRVRIWEARDVERHAEAALAEGQPAIAALIRTQWEIGQRLTDARLFRHGAEYDETDGVFRFHQSKTDSYVTIPISQALQETLKAAKRDGSFYLFTNEVTGKPFTEHRLSQEFLRIRKAVPGSRLVLRALRHSCVVQLARAGATVPQIAAVTGHALQSAAKILASYLPRDNQVAWEAQALRGIVERPSDTDGERRSDGRQTSRSDRSASDLHSGPENPAITTRMRGAR